MQPPEYIRLFNCCPLSPQRSSSCLTEREILQRDGLTASRGSLVPECSRDPQALIETSTSLSPLFAVTPHHPRRADGFTAGTRHGVISVGDPGVTWKCHADCSSPRPSPGDDCNGRLHRAAAPLAPPQPLCRLRGRFSPGVNPAAGGLRVVRPT